MTGVFYVPLRNVGVERTPNKSQPANLTLQKKIFPPLLLGFELATFRSRVRRSYQQAIPVVVFYTAHVIISPHIVSIKPKSLAKISILTEPAP